MPRVKIKAGDHSEVAAAEGFAAYAGPPLPKGVYKAKIKMWNLLVNSSGDHMFKILFEVNEPAGTRKAKYNGYPLWHQANLTEVSAPYVNAMLDVLEIPRKGVWSAGPIIEQGGDITASMGAKVVKVGGKSPLGIECLVVTKPNKYKGVTTQQPASFATIPEGYGENDMANDDDDDEDYSDESEDSSDDENDDEGDSDSSDDDSEDDEDDAF